MGENTPYFDWFKTHCFQNLEIKTLSLAKRIWRTTKGKEVVSVIPPLEEITIPHIDNIEIIASPFKKIKEEKQSLETQSLNRNDIKNIQH